MTGATGFIGSRLVKKIPARAFVRVAQAGGPEVVIGDLSSRSCLLAACDGIDTIFHCAGYAHAFSESDPHAHWRINYEGTKNLLGAAVARGVKRFIFLSSIKAMAEPGGNCVDESFSSKPESPYGQSKRAAEEAVLEIGEKHGMHVVNLRLAMVYGCGGRGNLERLVRAIRAGWFPPLPETGNRRSLVHVDDVIRAMRLVAEQPDANAKTYIVADYRSYSGREIYNAIREALGLPSVSWSISDLIWRSIGRIGDELSAVTGRAVSLNSEVVSRLLDSACYSPAFIEQDLGWKAQVSLAEGLREMLQPVRHAGATSPRN